MVNQQLKDYINEQVRVGVSKDAIRGALLEAGWGEAEVNEAMGLIPGAVATPRVDAVAPAMTTMQPKPMMQTKPAIAAASRMDAISKPITVRTSTPTMTVTQTKPAQKMESVAMGAMAMEKPRGGHRLIELVMGLLILVLGAAAVVFFLKFTGLQKDLGMVMTDRDSVNTQIVALRTENDALKADRATLQGEKADLEAELRIFTSATVGEEEILVKGTLVSGTDKNPYTVRTAHNASVVLKNSRLPAVEALLVPFVGKDIVILAKHQAGSKDVTITEVNGTPVAAATSSPALP